MTKKLNAERLMLNAEKGTNSYRFPVTGFAFSVAR